MTGYRPCPLGDDWAGNLWFGIMLAFLQHDMETRVFAEIWRAMDEQPKIPRTPGCFGCGRELPDPHGVGCFFAAFGGAETL